MVEEGLKLINQGSNPVEVKKGILETTFQKLWYSLFCSIGVKMNIPAMAIIVIENNITYPTFSFFIFYLVKDCE